MQPQPPPPPLVSFYCQCGTPLSAAVGTPTVKCHACGTTMGVPVAAPPPAAGYPPPTPLDYTPDSLRPAKSGTLFYVLAGVAAVAGLFVAVKGAAALHSDKALLNKAMLALFVLAVVLAVVGYVRSSKR